MKKKNIAVFCGSKAGNNELFEMHARQLGEMLAAQGFDLVYGGGGKGLMGAVANAALEGGAFVTGVIPETLHSREHQHNHLSELKVVPDMHTRKRMMYELCDAAIILPGGFGTMDELFEMLTWNQLAILDKPIFVLNTAGYYNTLVQLMQNMQWHGFLYDDLASRVIYHDLPQDIMQELERLGKNP